MPPWTGNGAACAQSAMARALINHDEVRWRTISNLLCASMMLMDTCSNPDLKTLKTNPAANKWLEYLMKWIIECT